MENLPNDILVEVSNHLEVTDLAKFAKSCKHLNTILTVETVWRFQLSKIVDNVTSISTLETLKRIHLIPVYYCLQCMYYLNLTPFAYVKRSDLENTNLLFASRILSNSFLIVVNARFEYQWTICIMNNTIYQCRTNNKESKRAEDRRLDSQTLSVLWIGENTCSEYDSLLDGFNKWMEEPNRMFVHLGSGLVKLVRTRLDKDYKFPSCEGIGILNVFNLTIPREKLFKNKITRLANKGNGIIFCNEFRSNNGLYLQVVYITIKNTVEFKMFELKLPNYIRRMIGFD